MGSKDEVMAGVDCGMVVAATPILATRSREFLRVSV